MITEHEFDETIILITLLFKKSFQEAMEEENLEDSVIDRILDRVAAKLKNAEDSFNESGNL